MKATIPKGLPTIGWWMDNEIIPCYHGTFSHKYQSIQEKGLLPGSTGFGYVSPSYHTAATFAIWGLHGIDYHVGRSFSVPLQLYQPNCYCVIHFGIPRDFMQEHAVRRDPREGTYFRPRPPVLEDRKLFESFRGSPEEYYSMSECKFACTVPPEYIVGISFPYT